MMITDKGEICREQPVPKSIDHNIELRADSMGPDFFNQCICYSILGPK